MGMEQLKPSLWFNHQTKHPSECFGLHPLPGKVPFLIHIQMPYGLALALTISPSIYYPLSPSPLFDISVRSCQINIPKAQFWSCNLLPRNPQRGPITSWIKPKTLCNSLNKSTYAFQSLPLSSHPHVLQLRKLAWYDSTQQVYPIS